MTWSHRTGGQLSRAERRELLRPLARAHVANVAGRTAMLLRLNSGWRAELAPSDLRLPSSNLTRTAVQHAQRRLSPALLNHSHRSYLFGVALASLENIDVDRELLFAAAMLHDLGLAAPVAGVDFTVASARAAREVAKTVGLSSGATEVIGTAITLHHSPGVTLGDGPVAYLLSAGAALDVIGLRSWQLPPDVLRSVAAERPRCGFKREFRSAWAAEAAAVPQGRARLLRRYGAFDLAIRLAPFSD
jgi:hypothetical protein